MVVNNSTSSDIEQEPEDAGSPFMLAFYIIIKIFVTGLLENSLVLAVICGKKEPKSVNEMFIVNLTISDITFLAFESPVNVYIYFVPRCASIFICKVVFPMLTATFIVSVATVASMSIQRCYAILNPFKPRMKRKSLVVWLVAIWILSFLSVTPQIIVTSPLGTCSEEWPSHVYRKLYTIFLFVLQYVFPLIAITVSYIKIAIYVSKSNCISRQLGRTNAHNNRGEKEEVAIKRTI